MLIYICNAIGDPIIKRGGLESYGSTPQIFYAWTFISYQCRGLFCFQRFEMKG